MELTVLVPLLSLLVLKLGYADHDKNLYTASPASPEQAPAGPAGDEVPGSNQNHSIQAWKISDAHSNSSSSLINNAVVEIKNSSESAEYNVTDVGTANVSYRHEASAVPAPLKPNSTLLPTPGVIHINTDAIVHTTLLTNDSDISNHSAALDPVSVPSKQPETALNASTTEPKVSSASSPSSRHPVASSTAQLKPTAQSDTSSQTKAHTGRPAQLNVGVTSNKTPTLDPLLAGLVSAFILTAIIIASLLFFKLRRRDTRPGFRRLQDLPMDDMMEDAPLSMYSY